MAKYLIWLLPLMLLSCNSGGHSSEVAPIINDLSLSILSPLKINQSAYVNLLCLNLKTTNILNDEALNVSINSANNNIATVNPSNCILINRIGGTCCQFQTTALATGSVTINASAPGHTAQGQILTVIPN